jgi:glutamyl-Q tRNA(Asp) synthetase
MDDALQGVSHVVRGTDLYTATPVHRLLQALLGLPEPIYHHHSLIVGSAGEKLSKSLKSRGLRALRQQGLDPSDIRRLVKLV